MDNYLIDRETLSQFVDELIKRKPLPVNTAEELTNFREEQIKALDDQINQAIFSQLTPEQDRELGELLDQGEEDPLAFKAFFERIGVDLEQTIANAMEKFSNAYFEGGQNV